MDISRFAALSADPVSPPPMRGFSISRQFADRGSSGAFGGEGPFRAGEKALPAVKKTGATRTAGKLVAVRDRTCRPSNLSKLDTYCVQRIAPREGSGSANGGKFVAVRARSSRPSNCPSWTRSVSQELRRERAPFSPAHHVFEGNPEASPHLDCTGRAEEREDLGGQR